MKLFRILFCVPILFGLVCSGCSSNSSNPVEEDSKEAYTIFGPDYRNQGKTPYESIEDKLISTTGCEVAYTYFEPRDVSKDVLVVIGHGFLRSKKRMAHLAQHLATWGLSVVNVELCNSKYTLSTNSNVIKVEDASHCHFEFPVDGKCLLVCGKGERRFSRKDIQQTLWG